MQSFLDNIENGESLPLAEVEALKKQIVYKSIPKGTLLQKMDDVVHRSYFVKKGCLRSYFVDSKGKEHIYMFAPEGWIIGDLESHVNNSPAGLYIDALEDSDIEVLDRTLFDRVYFGQLAAKAGTDKLLRRISVLQKRVIMLLSATAVERYLYFIDIYPDIVQRVPQKMIASYLGITPEALSRIKHQLAKPKEF